MGDTGCWNRLGALAVHPNLDHIGATETGPRQRACPVFARVRHGIKRRPFGKIFEFPIHLQVGHTGITSGLFFCQIIARFFAIIRITFSKNSNNRPFCRLLDNIRQRR
jgi:hypothetical protein